MLDFAEVGRRIQMRNCTCGRCNPEEVSHEFIVSPLLGQLFDPEYYEGNGALITPHECVNLAMTMQRQAQLLDEKDAELREAMVVLETQQGFIEVFSKRLKRLNYCVAAVLAFVAWLTAVAIGVAF